MTPAAQQPEQKCSHYDCHFYFDGDCIAPCTRPHTPAPALFQIEPNSHDYTIGQIVEINENIQKQRKEVARAATLAENKRVFDAIKHLIEYNGDLFQCLGDTVLPKKVVAYEFLLSEEGIESLRQQEGEQ